MIDCSLLLHLAILPHIYTFSWVSSLLLAPSPPLPTLAFSPECMCLWQDVALQMFRLEGLFLSPFSTASDKLSRGLVFTHSASPATRCFATHSSGTLFMYSSIMSQEISSFWSAHTNPSLFSRSHASVLPRPLSVCASPAPLPFRLSQPSLCTHQIPWPSSVKTSKQKGLQPPLRHVARHPSLRGHKREGGKNATTK